MNAVATKKSRAQNAHGGALLHATAETERPIAVVATALTTLIQQAKAHYDGAGPDEVCVHAHTLIDMTLEELQKLSDGANADHSDSMYRIAACLAGALDHDRASSPKATARHAMLQQACAAAESASISFGFTQDPCEELAAGIKAGQAMTQAAQQQPEDEETDDEERRSIAFDANYSIQELAKALKIYHQREASDDWPVYCGILGQIQQLSEVVFCAMRLGGTEESMTYPNLETLQHFMDGHFTLIVRDEA